MAEEIVEAPMRGRVIRVHVQTGSRVSEGDKICDIESLKLEAAILATTSGTVKTVHVSAGQTVEGGDPLAVIVE